MHRSRLFVPLASLAATLAIAPMLAVVALAADPIVVGPGDTLTGISKRHGVPISEIVEINDLPNPDRIYVGQRLRLHAETASPAPPAPASSAPRSHTVAPGENLTRIARRYGVTVNAIVTANAIANPSRIYAGQQITIPGGAAEAPATRAASPAPPASSASRSHTVAPGENLTRIARRYGVTVNAIVTANGIANPSRIYAGQRITIPGGAASPENAAPSSSIPASMAAIMARRDDVRRIIVEEAGRYEVPAPLALAVAWHESGWQQGVVSRAGAVGVMQVLPSTGEWVGEAMLGQRVDLTNTRQNVRAGVRLLAHYLDRYDGSVDLVLAAYYQGQTAADRHGVYPVSRPYIASIKALVQILGG